MDDIMFVMPRENLAELIRTHTQIGRSFPEIQMYRKLFDDAVWGRPGVTELGTAHIFYPQTREWQLGFKISTGREILTAEQQAELLERIPESIPNDIPIQFEYFPGRAIAAASQDTTNTVFENVIYATFRGQVNQ